MIIYKVHVQVMWYLIGNKMMNSTARTFHAQVRLERCKTDGDIIIKGKLKRPHVRLNLSWFVNNMITSFYWINATIYWNCSNCCYWFKKSLNIKMKVGTNQNLCLHGFMGVLQSVYLSPLSMQVNKFLFNCYWFSKSWCKIFIIVMRLLL